MTGAGLALGGAAAKHLGLGPAFVERRLGRDVDGLGLLPGQLQHLHEQLGDRGRVSLPEPGDRGVVGRVLRTRNDIVVMQGEAVLGLEAALAATIRPARRILSISGRDLRVTIVSSVRPTRADGRAGPAWPLSLQPKPGGS